MNDYQIYFNTNIKYLRKKNEETQSQLGKIINKKDSTIGNYEKGIRTPGYIELCLIADHYAVKLDDLIRRDLRKENY